MHFLLLATVLISTATLYIIILLLNLTVWLVYVTFRWCLFANFASLLQLCPPLFTPVYRTGPGMPVPVSFFPVYVHLRQRGLLP